MSTPYNIIVRGQDMKKYTLEQFAKKYAGERHISCGINYIDGSHDTMMNASCSQIMSFIRIKGVQVAFIVARR